MQTVNFRATDTMVAAIDEVAKRDGGNRTLAIRSLLQQALGARGVSPYADPALVVGRPSPLRDAVRSSQMPKPRGF